MTIHHAPTSELLRIFRQAEDDGEELFSIQPTRSVLHEHPDCHPVSKVTEWQVITRPRRTPLLERVYIVCALFAAAILLRVAEWVWFS